MRVVSLVRWVLRVVAGLLALLLVLLVVVDTPWAEERIRRLIVREANAALTGELTIGALSGSLPGGDVTLSDIRLTDAAGDVATIDAVTLRFRPFRLLTAGLVADELLIRGPTVHVSQTADGWNVARLTRPSADEPAAPPVLEAAIERIGLTDGRLHLSLQDQEPRTIGGIEFEGRVAAGAAGLRVSILHAAARDEASGLTLRTFTADIAAGDDGWTVDNVRLATGLSEARGRTATSPDDVTLSVDVAPLALREFAAWVPQFGAVPDATLALSLRGSLARLTIDWRLQSSAGSAHGRLEGAMTNEAVAFAGPVTIDALDLARWLSEPRFRSPVSLRGSVDARLPGGDTAAAVVTFDTTVPSIAFDDFRLTALQAKGTWAAGTLDVTARARAYGASVSTDARLNAELGTFTARGQLASLDVAALPAALGVPPIDTRIGARFALAGGADGVELDLTFDESVVEGGTIAEGAVARVDLRADPIAWSFTGSLRDVDPSRFASPGPGPAALADVPGRLHLEVDLSGSGTTPDAMAADGRVAVADSTLGAIRIDTLGLRASLAAGRLAARAEGRLRELSDEGLGLGDPGWFTAETGELDVALTVPDVTAPFDWTAIDGAGRVRLARATVRSVAIDTVVLNATLTGGTVIVAGLDVTGPDLRATSSGRLVLAGDGSSDLTVAVGLDDLSRFREAAAQEIFGAVRLEARARGPAGGLTVTGTLHADDLAAAGSTVKSLDVEYEADLGAFDPAGVAAVARVTGSGLDVSGTPVNDVTARLGWEEGRLDAQVRAADDTRVVQVAADVVPESGRTLVELRELIVTAGAARWALAPGRVALIEYADQRVGVRGFVLVTGGEGRLTLDGTLGVEAPIDGGAFEVAVNRVRIEDLVALAGAGTEVAGELEAVGRVTGTLADPHAAATVGLRSVLVNGLEVHSLTGTAQYAARRLGVDVRLEAGPLGQLTAVGTVPLPGDDATAADRPEYDLRIRSGTIDLALFQPVVAAVEKLHGRAQFDVRLTGPAEEPRFDGAITLDDTGFRVVETGVTYRRLNAALAVKGRRVTVQRFTLEDADGHSARIQGELGVTTAGMPTGLDLRITTDGLHVLNNQFGEIAVTVELTAMGDLETPLLTGTIAVNRGLIEVANLMARLSATGYTALAENPAGGEGGVTETPMDRASLSITLDLPDNVVVRGRDIRTGTGPIGLGDINVTVGGALSIAKDSGQSVVLLGGLDVVRGQYQFQGRAFNIQRGSGVQFRGTSINPTLDVRAERVISGVTAEVRVGGSLDKPEIALSSSPPLDQGDILSLIVFNQAMNSLPTEQRVSLAARAGALAASAIATPLADSVARALDLDLFEIRTPEGPGGVASVTVGRQVSDRLFVGFRHDFGADDVSQVSFEYRLTEFLRIVTSFAQGGGSTRSVGAMRAEAAGIDLIFVIRR